MTLHETKLDCEDGGQGALASQIHGHPPIIQSPEQDQAQHVQQILAK